MLKNFYKSKLGTKAVEPFIFIKLKARSIVIRPLVMIGEPKDYEQVAPKKKDKDYNL